MRLVGGDVFSCGETHALLLLLRLFERHLNDVAWLARHHRLHTADVFPSRVLAVLDEVFVRRHDLLLLLLLWRVVHLQARVRCARLQAQI